MYFIKFKNIAVFVQESPKLGRRRSLSKVIYLENEYSYDQMYKKSPYANSRRFDYFGEKIKNPIPNYIMDSVLKIPEVENIIKQFKRDNKINSILTWKE